jgi:hypothetical protein
MALNFPNSPANGDIYQALGRGWKYNSTAGAWESLIRVNTAFDSDDITEGATNLYQNPENIQDEVNNLLQQGNNITLVYDDAANTMTISAVGSNTASDLLPDQNNLRNIGSTTLKWKDLHMAGNATIDGNLTVNGTTTTINSTQLDVDDLNITIASGAADSAAANGAGITVDGANATLTYSNTGDKWVFNKDLGTNGNNFLVADNDSIKIGSGDDLVISHSSSTNITTLALPATSDILQIKAGTGMFASTYLQATLGFVKLFGSTNLKFETTATGAKVTGDLEATEQVISTIATGTAPLSVTSTTKVSNLNADLLDGKHASDLNIEAIAFAIALG